MPNICKTYAQYATNMHNMQQICNKYTKHMQNICKKEGCRSLVGNVTELDAVGLQFEPYVTTGYSLCDKMYAKYM